jgi:hypothetical protein
VTQRNDFANSAAFAASAASAAMAANTSSADSASAPSLQEHNKGEAIASGLIED